MVFVKLFDGPWDGFYENMNIITEGQVILVDHTFLMPEPNEEHNPVIKDTSDGTVLRNAYKLVAILPDSFELHYVYTGKIKVSLTEDTDHAEEEATPEEIEALDEGFYKEDPSEEVKNFEAGTEEKDHDPENN
jgi:hypothetical protein